MTSWLDTKKYVASLAKNAIAEAQKTLDKALDIDENGEQEETEQSENQEISTRNSVNVIQSNVNLGLDQWGSFSGSFFSIPDRKASTKSNSRGMQKSFIFNFFLETGNSHAKSLTHNTDVKSCVLIRAQNISSKKINTNF